MSRRKAALHTRLSMTFGALMALVVVALLGTWLWTSATYERQLRQQLNSEVARHLAEHAVPLTPDGVDQGELQAMLMHVMSVNPALEVYLLDREGGIIAYDAPEGHVKAERVTLAPIEELLENGAAGVLGDDPRAPGQSSPISVWPLTNGGDELGYVYVVIGGEEWRAASGPLRGVQQLTVVGAAGLSLLAIGLVASIFFARRLTRPLRQLRAAIGSDDVKLTRELQHAQDEFGELARAYESMSKHIQSQVQHLERTDEERRDFVASVSHDLRTPLASLEGYLELLEEEPDLDAEQRAEYLLIARRRARHLRHLVGQLFELAKLEAGDILPQPEPFDLAELTQDVLQGQRQRATKQKVKLVCSMPSKLPEVSADLGLIERAITNLVDNALKFTPAGGEVRVALARSRLGVRWSVKDDGPGIASEDLPRVFESRYRGRGRSLAPGSGLGLAITRRVLELHDAEIQVQSEEGAGCMFEFELAPA